MISTGTWCLGMEKIVLVPLTHWSGHLLFVTPWARLSKFVRKGGGECGGIYGLFCFGVIVKQILCSVVLKTIFI